MILKELRIDSWVGDVTNCYIVQDEKSKETMVIDPAGDVDKIVEMLDILNANLKYILLTHGHFDHIGGVPEIKEKFGAKVVISEADSGMLSSGKASLAAFCGINQQNTSADILVAEGSEIMLGKTKISVIATPGHTKGGVCYLADDCIFTGDTLFFCSCGRTDFPGGSAKEIMQSLKRLSALDSALKVYPGHDRFSTIGFEKQNNPYMR